METCLKGIKMKLIEQGYEIISLPENLLETLENAGRTCYKSEDKITGDLILDLSIDDYSNNETIEIPTENISNEEISNHTVSWFVLDDERYKELIKVDFRIKELRAGMDFTSPSITEERKKLIAKELIKRIDEILN